MKLSAITIGACSLLACSTANAADAYSPASLNGLAAANPATWSGFYFGINGGYGDGSSSRNSTLTATEDYGHGYSWKATGDIAGTSPTGGLFGAQAGYRAQIGNSLVIGAEVSFDGSNIEGTHADIGNTKEVDTYPRGSSTYTGNSVTAFHQKLNYLGTATLLAGVSLGDALVFGEAGLAFGDTDTTASIGSGDGSILTRSSTDVGWTVGLGGAYKIAPRWEAFAKVNYVDLGSYSLSRTFTDNSYTPAIPVHVSTSSISNDYVIAKVGVNYQPSGAYVPLK